MGNSQKLSKFNFEWVEDTSQFNEDFTKNLCEKSEKVLLERNKLGKVEKLVSSLEDKSGCYSHKKFETGFKSWSSSKKSS